MPLLLVVAFIVVPLIELAVIAQVGQVVGLGWTLVALLVVSIAGAWLVRREGTRAWGRFRTALGAGRMPTDEVLAGALVLVGGALLLTPGFVTDALGLLLVLPPTRALAVSAIRTQVGRRISITTIGGPGLFGGRAGSGGPRPSGRGPGADGPGGPGRSGSRPRGGRPVQGRPVQDGSPRRGRSPADDDVEIEVVDIRRDDADAGDVRRDDESGAA